MGVSFSRAGKKNNSPANDCSFRFARELWPSLTVSNTMIARQLILMQWVNQLGVNSLFNGIPVTWAEREDSCPWVISQPFNCHFIHKIINNYLITSLLLIRKIDIDWGGIATTIAYEMQLCINESSFLRSDCLAFPRVKGGRPRGERGNPKWNN